MSEHIVITDRKGILIEGIYKKQKYAVKFEDNRYICPTEEEYEFLINQKNVPIFDRSMNRLNPILKKKEQHDVRESKIPRARHNKS